MMISDGAGALAGYKTRNPFKLANSRALFAARVLPDREIIRMPRLELVLGTTSTCTPVPFFTRRASTGYVVETDTTRGAPWTLREDKLSARSRQLVGPYPAKKVRAAARGGWCANTSRDIIFFCRVLLKSSLLQSTTLLYHVTYMLPFSK